MEDDAPKPDPAVEELAYRISLRVLERFPWHPIELLERIDAQRADRLEKLLHEDRVAHDEALKRFGLELTERLERLVTAGLSSARCRFSGDQAADITEFLAVPAKRTDALKNLEDWTLDANDLVIVDPYLLASNHSDSHKAALRAAKAAGTALPPADAAARAQEIADYASELVQAVGPATTVLVYHLPGPDAEVVAAVTSAMGNRSFSTKETTAIHDRVWIKNNATDALLVGTSFHGIGAKKFSFLLPLPPSDLAAFAVELKKL